MEVRVPLLYNTRDISEGEELLFYAAPPAKKPKKAQEAVKVAKLMTRWATDSAGGTSL